MASTVVHVARASGAASKPAAAESDEIDALSEAELFLNFGRDAQAEEILKDALNKNPANVPVQLKLLSIYATRKDANNFSTIARKLKDMGDEAAWNQAAAMGRSIDPSNPMYGEGEAVAPDVLSESGKHPAAPALDMDIGFNVPMDLDVTAAAPVVDAGNTTMDFDISGHTSNMAAGDIGTGQPEETMNFDITGQSSAGMDFDISGSTASPMDLDVTGSHAGVVADASQEEVPLSGLSMDFDITGSHPGVVAMAGQPEEASSLSSLSMDFDITGSHPNLAGVAPVEASPPSTMDFDVTGSHPEVADTQHMDFDLTGTHPSLSGGATEAEDLTSTVVMEAPMDLDISAPMAPLDVSSDTEESVLDLTGGLTFDITGESGKQPEVDMDFGDIGLGAGSEVSTLVSPVAAAKMDEKWQEVATKLDLAKAYQEMGDVEGAREILNEVLRDGDEQQRDSAQALMQQL